MNEQLTIVLKVLGIIILAAVALTALVIFFERISVIMTIIIGAIFLCYLIYPSVMKLHTWVPLWIAILIVYAIIIGAVVIFLTAVLPMIMQNVHELSQEVPSFVKQTQSAFANPHNPFVNHLPAGRL